MPEGENFTLDEKQRSVVIRRALFDNDDKLVPCQGTLVEDVDGANVIVTSAECVQYGVSDIAYFEGNEQFKATRLIVPQKNNDIDIYIHPDYSQTYPSANLAVIRVNLTDELNDQVSATIPKTFPTETALTTFAWSTCLDFDHPDYRKQESVYKSFMPTTTNEYACVEIGGAGTFDENGNLIGVYDHHSNGIVPITPDTEYGEWLDQVLEKSPDVAYKSTVEIASYNPNDSTNWCLWGPALLAAFLSLSWGLWKAFPVKRKTL